MTGPDQVDARPAEPARPRPAAAPVASRSGIVGAFESDWPAEAADRIVDLVDNVRDKTTGPVQRVARAIVYGLLVAVTGIVVFVLVIIASIRALNVLVDHFWPWGHAWLPYLILGTIFLVAGAIVFRLRRPRVATPTP
jgi:hypothetical protein